MDNYKYNQYRSCTRKTSRAHFYIKSKKYVIKKKVQNENKEEVCYE